MVLTQQGWGLILLSTLCISCTSSLMDSLSGRPKTPASSSSSLLLCPSLISSSSFSMSPASLSRSVSDSSDFVFGKSNCFNIFGAIRLMICRKQWIQLAGPGKWARRSMSSLIIMSLGDTLSHATDSTLSFLVVKFVVQAWPEFLPCLPLQNRPEYEWIQQQVKHLNESWQLQQYSRAGW